MTRWSAPAPHRAPPDCPPPEPGNDALPFGADNCVDHYGEYAEERHRHYDLERDDETAQRDIRRLQQDVRELRVDLDNALGRIRQLEGSTPEAWQAQYEADVAAADLAASGYDDGPDLEEYDPGMSEYRYVLPEDYQRGQS